MDIKPLRNNLVIKADKDDGKVGSILVAREWEKLPHTGEVISIGPDILDIKVGNKVHFNRYAFQKVDEELFIGLDKNVNAIL